MSFCAYCGAAAAVVSYQPCPNCGNPTNGAPRPKLGMGGTNVLLIVIGVAVVGLISVAIIGILAAIAIPNLLTAKARSAQKRTMADMRSIATAVEAYAVDTNQFPRATSLEELRPIIEPKYIRTMPTVDCWGHAFRYDSSRGEPGYFLGSAGKDGRFDHNSLSEYSDSATQNFDCDIVFANGKFVQYPEGVQH
jgi:general secretion pathway protein G